jgi:hypothetical protein
MSDATAATATADTARSAPRADCISIDTLQYVTNARRGPGVDCVNGPLDGLTVHAPAGTKDLAVFAPGVVSHYQLRRLRFGRLLEWTGDLEWPTS